MRKILFMTSVILAICSYSHPGFSSPNHGNEMRVISVKISDFRTDLARLRAAGYNIVGVSHELGIADLEATEVQESYVNEMGLETISIRQFNTAVAPDEGYHTYEEVLAKLRHWQQRYPDIMNTENIGKSWENRDIVAVKISDQVSQDQQEEPAILFNAMHHAREIMTTEVALDIIENLLENYNKDQKVRDWVDQNEIWIVPMVNPDGNNKVWTEDTWWRKNVRDGHGVDLNRNYPFDWNACNGSSDYEQMDDYRGPSAASEPETKAMIGLIDRIKPVFDISYHTYSELVIYPYGCDGKRAADRAIVEGIGEELAKNLVRDSGEGHYKPGTAWELLYTVDGADIDWMHNVHGTIAYVIEVNSTSQGFHPEHSWVQPTLEKMRPGWRFLLDKLQAQNVRGRVARHQETSAVVSAVSLNNGKVTTGKIKEDGTFDMLLNPGMYRVEVRQDGVMASKDVIVGSAKHFLEFNL